MPSSHNVPKDRGLTAAYLRTLYRLDADGVLWHKRRPIWMFAYCKNPLQSCNAWNARYAGKEVNAGANKYKRTHVPLLASSVRIRVHHIIECMRTGVWPTQMTDHINGDTLNNSFNNLRPATDSQSTMNRGMLRNNTSGVTGVSWHKVRQKWYARITAKGKKIILYRGDSFDDAVAARRAGELKYHGKYRRKTGNVLC